MRDAHQVIVHNGREVVGRETVRLDEDLHVDLLPGNLDVAPDAVGEPAGTGLTGHRAVRTWVSPLDALSRLSCRIEVPAEPVVARRLAVRLLPRRRASRRSLEQKHRKAPPEATSSSAWRR